METYFIKSDPWLTREIAIEVIGNVIAHKSHLLANLPLSETEQQSKIRHDLLELGAERKSCYGDDENLKNVIFPRVLTLHIPYLKRVQAAGM